MSAAAAVRAVPGHLRQPEPPVTVVTEKLKVLHEEAYPAAADPFAPATLSTSVDRRTLREILASGLEDRIVTGKELTRYEADERGVRLFFADGDRPLD